MATDLKVKKILFLSSRESEAIRKVPKKYPLSIYCETNIIQFNPLKYLKGHPAL